MIFTMQHTQLSQWQDTASYIVAVRLQRTDATQQGLLKLSSCKSSKSSKELPDSCQKRGQQPACWQLQSTMWGEQQKA